MTITYTAAFLGGLLSLLAPCGAMLLPAFFTYSFASKSRLIARTGIFLLGLLTVLVPLGLTLSSLSRLILTNRGPLMIAVGIFSVIAGVVTALALPLPKFGFKTPAGQPKQPKDRSSSLAIYLLGISYGCAGVGCSGPILGTILGLSATASSPLAGGLTMAAYALGMALPLLLLALSWQALDLKRYWRPRPVRFLGRETTVGSLISGIAFIILGLVLIFTRGDLSFGLLDGNTQVALEAAIISTFESIPNFIFIALAVVLTAIVVLLARSRRP